MFSVTRGYEFSAAHRLVNHPKCSRLHGHNYGITVTISNDKLDSNGMVIEFGNLDMAVEPLIEAMDHMYIHPNEQSETFQAGVSETFFLPALHSTAECIAEHICKRLRAVMPWALLIRVDVAETSKSVASYVSSK